MASTPRYGDFLQHLLDNDLVILFFRPIWQQYGPIRYSVFGEKEIFMDSIKILYLNIALQDSLDKTTEPAKLSCFVNQIRCYVKPENRQLEPYNRSLIGIIISISEKAKIDEYHDQNGRRYYDEIACWKNCAEMMLQYYNSIMLSRRLDCLKEIDLDRIFNSSFSVFNFQNTKEQSIRKVIQYISSNYGIELDRDSEVKEIVDTIPGLSLKELVRIIFSCKKPKRESLIQKKMYNTELIVKLILENNLDVSKFTEAVNNSIVHYYSSSKFITSRITNIMRSGITPALLNELFHDMSNCSMISGYVVIHMLLQLGIDLAPLEKDPYWLILLPENQL